MMQSVSAQAHSFPGLPSIVQEAVAPQCAVTSAALPDRASAHKPRPGDGRCFAAGLVSRITVSCTALQNAKNKIVGCEALAQRSGMDAAIMEAVRSDLQLTVLSFLLNRIQILSSIAYKKLCDAPRAEGGEYFRMFEYAENTSARCCYLLMILQICLSLSVAQL
jgi:hypothetical protein